MIFRVIKRSAAELLNNSAALLVFLLYDRFTVYKRTDHACRSRICERGNEIFCASNFSRI